MNVSRRTSVRKFSCLRLRLDWDILYNSVYNLLDGYMVANAHGKHETENMKKKNMKKPLKILIKRKFT